MAQEVDRGILHIRIYRRYAKDHSWLHIHLLYAAIAFFCFLPTNFFAADFKLIFQDSVIEMRGKIVPGDYEKFKKVVAEGHSKLFHYFNEVHLISEGGDLIDAIKIGQLIRRLRMKTTIPGYHPQMADITSCSELPS